MNPLKSIKTLFFLAAAFLLWSALSGKGWMYDVPLLGRLKENFGETVVRIVVLVVSVAMGWLFFRFVW